MFRKLNLVILISMLAVFGAASVFAAATSETGKTGEFKQSKTLALNGNENSDRGGAPSGRESPARFTSIHIHCTFPPLRCEIDIIFGMATVTGGVMVEGEGGLVISHPTIKGVKGRSFKIEKDMELGAEDSRALGYKRIVIKAGDYKMPEKDQPLVLKIQADGKLSCEERFGGK